MTSGEIKASGGVTYWSMGQQIRRDALAAAYQSYGVSGFTPPPRTDSSALEAALKVVYPKPTQMIRPLKKRDTNGYTLVEEQRGEYRNEYVPQFNVKITDGCVDITSGDGARYDLQKAYEKAKGYLPGTSVSASLVGIAKRFQGTTLRDGGALYWLPEESTPQWRDLSRAVEACDMSSKTRIYLLRTIKDEDSLRAVQDAITTEILAEAKSLKQEIESGLLGQTALVNRQNQAIDLQKRIASFEAILGKGLSGLHAVVEHAKQAAVTAAMSALPGELFNY